MTGASTPHTNLTPCGPWARWLSPKARSFRCRPVGAWLIQFYGYSGKVETFRAAYAQWGAGIILLKGLTPIPYKIVTITSGFAGYNFVLFVLFSIVARAARFFLLAFLLHRFGERARHLIEKRLGLWVLLGAVMVVAGIAIALYLI
jgi:membrane protein DedA with SNARE-associated domain